MLICYNYFMIFKALFADLPEMMYTINLIPAINLGPFSLTSAAGLLLICSASAAALFYFKNNYSDEKKFKHIIIGLTAAAFLPLYLNFFYNNIYDLAENLNGLKYSASSKRVLRLCNMDNRQNLNGIYCRLFSFSTFVRNNLPPGQNVRLLAAPELTGFLKYYLYPDYKIADDADYLLIYYPIGYGYEGQTVYKLEAGKKIVIGRYDALFAKSNGELILKKQ
ncbi:MAG: hypothetical protein Q8O93_03185 [bacterium]|nr:hypothetical protein [bacterium]